MSGAATAAPRNGDASIGGRSRVRRRGVFGWRLTRFATVRRAVGGCGSRLALRSALRGLRFLARDGRPGRCVLARLVSARLIGRRGRRRRLIGRRLIRWLIGRMITALAILRSIDRAGLVHLWAVFAGRNRWPRFISARLIGRALRRTRGL